MPGRELSLPTSRGWSRWVSGAPSLLQSPGEGDGEGGCLGQTMLREFQLCQEPSGHSLGSLQLLGSGERCQQEMGWDCLDHTSCRAGCSCSVDGRGWNHSLINLSLSWAQPEPRAPRAVTQRGHTAAGPLKQEIKPKSSNLPVPQPRTGNFYRRLQPCWLCLGLAASPTRCPCMISGGC